MAKLQIRVYPNGEVKAETIGVKGKACMKYIPVIEKLTGASVTDSDFTKEFLEKPVQTELTEVEEVKL